jgi:hypothetical protein
MHALRFLCFFTAWAFVMHALHLGGLLPNTWPVAAFVFVVSQLFTWHAPGYASMYGGYDGGVTAVVDVIGHWLPLFVVPMAVTTEGIVAFFFAGLIYLAVMGPASIGRLYSDPLEYVYAR